MRATEFIPIRVSTLRGDLQIPFDAYLHVAGKHILYCRQGDSFEGQRLRRLKDKKLKNMFIHAHDEPKYLKYMAQNIEMAYDGSRGAPMDVRAQVIQGAQQAAAEDVMENPDRKIFYDVAKEGVRRYVDFILKENTALKAILNIENSDQNVAHHGVTVSTIAIAMAEELEDNTPEYLQQLGLGCLIHDIEHMHTGFSLARPRQEMSQEDLDLYRKHPVDGTNRTRSIEFYDPIVLKILIQHEEHIDGSGFPNGLRENQISAPALVAATANFYDRLVTFEGHSPKEALRKLLIDKVGLFPLDHLKALQSVLKHRQVL